MPSDYVSIQDSAAFFKGTHCEKYRYCLFRVPLFCCRVVASCMWWCRPAKGIVRWPSACRLGYEPFLNAGPCEAEHSVWLEEYRIRRHIT